LERTKKVFKEKVLKYYFASLFRAHKEGVQKNLLASGFAGMTKLKTKRGTLNAQRQTSNVFAW